MINFDTAKIYVEKVALDAMGIEDKSDEIINSLALNFLLVADYIKKYGEFNLNGIPVQENINMTGTVQDPGPVIGMTASAKKTGILE